MNPALLIAALALFLVGCTQFKKMTGGEDDSKPKDTPTIGGPDPISPTDPEFNIPIPPNMKRTIYHGALNSDGLVRVASTPNSFVDVFLKQRLVGQWFKLGNHVSEAFYYSFDPTAGFVLYHGNLDLTEYCVYLYTPY